MYSGFAVSTRALERSTSVSERGASKFFHCSRSGLRFLKYLILVKIFIIQPRKYRNNLRVSFKIVGLFRVLEFESDSIVKTTEVKDGVKLAIFNVF